MTETIVQETKPILDINGNSGHFDLQLLEENGGEKTYRFTVASEKEYRPKPISILWKIPAVNIKGVWQPTADFNKRFKADWELDNMESRISIDAPITLLFGANDENVFNVACSEAIEKLEISCKYREEDNCFYCKLILFTEQPFPIQNYTMDIRVDYGNHHMADALKNVASWWESFQELKPTPVPAISKKPLYSTWYQFHQDLEEDLLLTECTLAKEMGYEAIILDDGWQTLDNQRGYDYTGDWNPERFKDFKGLIKQIKDTGLKAAIWYSVPFCGKKSQAFQRFKGKFLTEEHRWAPVFDPRYPEVRAYLVSLYTTAVKEWDLDGLKLDFIDDFKCYPATNFNPEGKDTLSINAAVDKLLTTVITELRKIKPDIFIEFRQKYTGPAMRKYGNMLRAFDCPGDYTMNRVRIADIRMLAGETAVHADMVKWNFKESVEIAALHVLNMMFGVPQISIMLAQAPESHQKMVANYTKYWNANAAVLLSDDFYPKSPMENYPLITARNTDKLIVGVYGDQIVSVNLEIDNQIDVLNAKTSDYLILDMVGEAEQLEVKVWDCIGNQLRQNAVSFIPGSLKIEVPTGGLVQIIAKK